MGSNQSRGTGAQGRGRLASFILSDHRYVLLATSAVAALGMALSSSSRPAMSFMANAYMLEVVMYYILVAWLAVSAVALAFKLAKWRTYADEAPFTKPAVARALRYASYVIWLIVAVLAVDRIGMGVASAWATATAASSMPETTLERMLYILYRGAPTFYEGFKTTILLAVFGTVIAFFLALLLVFLRIQVIDRMPFSHNSINYIIEVLFLLLCSDTSNFDARAGLMWKTMGEDKGVDSEIFS